MASNGATEGELDGETHVEFEQTNESLERVDSNEQNTVTMAVTVDVSDMNERGVEVLQALARSYEDAFQEVVDKNRDYGFSFLATGCKLAATDGAPFETPVRSQTYGLLTRTGDKRERLIENVYGDGSAAVSDEPHLTARECGNYWFFTSFVLEHPELAAEFIDG